MNTTNTNQDTTTTAELAALLRLTVGSPHVHVHVTGHKWHHNFTRGFLWEREWSKVIK